jgi:hypothetical protein
MSLIGRNFENVPGNHVRHWKGFHRGAFASYICHESGRVHPVMVTLRVVGSRPGQVKVEEVLRDGDRLLQRSIVTIRGTRDAWVGAECVGHESIRIGSCRMRSSRYERVSQRNYGPKSPIAMHKGIANLKEVFWLTGNGPRNWRLLRSMVLVGSEQRWVSKLSSQIVSESRCFRVKGRRLACFVERVRLKGAASHMNAQVWYSRRVPGWVVQVSEIYSTLTESGWRKCMLVDYGLRPGHLVCRPSDHGLGENGLESKPSRE